MNNSIQSHFESKVLLVFLVVLFVSSGFIVYKFKYNNNKCITSDFLVDTDVITLGDPISFSDNSPNAYHWKWTFGDGNISYKSSIKYYYKLPGEYKVRLLVNNRCSVEKRISVRPISKTRDPNLLPKFSLDESRKIYVGSPVKFIDSSAHAKSWEWYLEGTSTVTSTEKNPTYTYDTPGIKKIALVVNKNSEYTAFKEITVYAKKKKRKSIHKNRVAQIDSAEKSDIVKNYFKSNIIPDTIISPTKKNKTNLEMNEEFFIGCLQGIIKKKLDYVHFKSFFCEENLPKVILKDGSAISLIDLYLRVSKKRRIKTKFINLHRNSEDCVDIINISYK